MRSIIIGAALLACAGCASAPSSDMPTEEQVRDVMAGRAQPTTATDPAFVMRRAMAERDAGRHTNAAHLYRLAAIQGYAPAQAALAGAYAEGKGVRQDHVEAYRWANAAAEQGNPGGQALAGVALAYGLGAPRDPVRAYVWLTLALAQADEATSRHVRDEVGATLTAAQRRDAQRMVLEWRRR